VVVSYTRLLFCRASYIVLVVLEGWLLLSGVLSMSSDTYAAILRKYPFALVGSTSGFAWYRRSQRVILPRSSSLSLAASWCLDKGLSSCSSLSMNDCLDLPSSFVRRCYHHLVRKQIHSENQSRGTSPYFAIIFSHYLTENSDLVSRLTAFALKRWYERGMQKD
jgi:hypothetical protein